MGIMSRSYWTSRISNLWVTALRSSKRKRTRRNQVAFEMERLEERALLTAAHPLFSEGTSSAYVEQVEAEMGHDPSEARVQSWWRTTATNGSGNNLGDPVTVTWSIVPDGSIQDNGRPSDLVSRLGEIYGVNTDDTNYEDEPWFPLVNSTFERWEAVSGITFTYEPNDDGARHSFGSTGTLGVRGDIRIGGTRIDGNSGVLAYNYYPSGGGDMVIDTADSFYNYTGSNSLRLRNVVAHEIGHGIGLGHVSTNVGSLMNPFLSTSFDGPQFDDILAAQRAYGDPNESLDGNESFDDATDLGVFGDGDVLTIGSDADSTSIFPLETDFASVRDGSDSDFFMFTVGDGSNVTLTLDSIGPSYDEGPQGGSRTNFDASQQSDLTLTLLAADGTTVLGTSNSAGLGGSESITDSLGAGTYFIRVTGSANATQFYQLSTAVDVDASFTDVSISATDAQKLEGHFGTSVFTFTVTRSGDTAGTSSVQYAVDFSSGNSASPNDFNGATSGTVNFEPGETSKVITISVNGDSEFEADETFTVKLSNALGASIQTDSAGGMIQNDDSQVTITATDASKREGSSGTTAFTFEVTRTGDTSNPVTVTYTLTGRGAHAADANDFGGTLPSGTVTIPAGQTSTTLTIHVTGEFDVEEHEGFTVTLSNPLGGVEFVTPSADGTIFNDDSSVSITATSAHKAEGDSGTTTFTFTVTRIGDTSVAATVDYIVTGSVDAADFGGTLPGGTLTFLVGQSTHVLTLNVSGDSQLESDETFTVALINPSDPLQVDTATATGIILNDDSVGSSDLAISAVDSSKKEGDSGDVTVYTFVVTRTGSTSSSATVDYVIMGSGAHAADAGDFAVLTGTVHFASGETTALIEVEVRGDDGVEAHEGFTVTLENASAGATIVSDSADGMILNDDSGISLAGHTVVVAGSAGADYFLIDRSGGQIRARHYNYTTRTWTFGAFPQADATDLLVQGFNGWNYIYVSSTITIDARIEGGDDRDIVFSGRGNDSISTGGSSDYVWDSRGNDVIDTGDGNDVVYAGHGNDIVRLGDGDDYARGGRGHDVIFGGDGINVLAGDSGHDVLVGGGQFDRIYGGHGRDLLIGGGGSDWLFGQNGHDILIGGSTDYDSHIVSLVSILRGWMSSTSYDSNVNNVVTGSGFLAGTGVRLEAGSTVHDDGVRDYMFGNNGRDLFFGDLDGLNGNDDGIGRSANETAIHV